MLYKLQKPFDYGKKTYTEVELREDYLVNDVVRIQNAHDKGSGSAFLAVLTAATGWDATMLAAVSSVDAVEIAKAVTPFLGNGLE